MSNSLPCGCSIDAHPSAEIAPELDAGYYYERCERGWPLLGIDGSPLLTREGERLSLELAREDDTAEYVLEYLDRVRATGRFHPLRRGLALEVIGPLTILRIPDAAFALIASALDTYDPTHRRAPRTAVSINLGNTNLVVVPTTPVRPAR